MFKNARAAHIVKEYSRKMYGRKKEYVDMEIEARLGITKTDEKPNEDEKKPNKEP